MPTEDPNDRTDVEQLADALLAAGEQAADTDDGAEPDDIFSATAQAFRQLGIDFVRRYNRLEIDVEAGTFDQPVLFVANHGVGGGFDLNVAASFAALDEIGLDRPLTILAHQMAWTFGIGRFVESLGARVASRTSAEEAFEQGHHVLVFPGGDIEAAKSFEDRNRVIFSGRAGFARLAIDNKTPIVPIVTAGAGESLLVLSSGQRLARALRLDKTLRLKAAPISVSLPWGVSVGATGFLPYLPLPTKLYTRVLPAIEPTEGEEPDIYAARVQAVMQEAMDEMTEDRRPLLG